ncbi:hypothetical protein Ae201684_012132 [Aphanomyces euteiches]|uniref:Uncharacterized protein n=1 Tax=Aphanomyces euteiches TaxID=100861 RepID=A0A6G0WSG9_9STRA|nr:hypothetical protein Ae201684_012132 [Aphanomyces euteiches]
MSKQARQASKTSTKTTAHRLVSPATMEQALPLPFGQQRRHMAPSRPARPHRALTWLRAASMAENGHGNVPALRTSLSSTDSKHKQPRSQNLHRSEYYFVNHIACGPSTGETDHAAYHTKTTMWR